MPYAREPDTSYKPAYKKASAPSRKSSAQNEKTLSNVVSFKQKEVDMMPGDWAEVGNPTPYELCTTIHTCKRFWHMNKQALTHPDCDVEVTEYNIRVLEKLYIHLMSYLVE
ncbi:hypothetical protein [Hydrogenovibrio sp. JE_KL2]|uniref:hypothetical protein n=1 Tax=Hydrogenovibrio sp. JE_KL2 TaxID=2651188 RepID=UPI00128D0EDF|nr:hypothetical protein [Hydrogenovibrio sp. JE_KL2]MPQ75845.1 hypothetical protein [Hydrogenovibrio sp. JE_KL2]